MNKLYKYIFLFIIPILFTGCISVTQELPPFTTYTISLKQDRVNNQINNNNQTKKSSYES